MIDFWVVAQFENLPKNGWCLKSAGSALVLTLWAVLFFGGPVDAAFVQLQDVNGSPNMTGTVLFSKSHEIRCNVPFWNITDAKRSAPSLPIQSLGPTGFYHDLNVAKPAKLMPNEPTVRAINWNMGGVSYHNWYGHSLIPFNHGEPFDWGTFRVIDSGPKSHYEYSLSSYSANSMRVFGVREPPVQHHAPLPFFGHGVHVYIGPHSMNGVLEHGNIAPKRIEREVTTKELADSSSGKNYLVVECRDFAVIVIWGNIYSGNPDSTIRRDHDFILRSVDDDKSSGIRDLGLCRIYDKYGYKESFPHTALLSRDASNIRISD